MKQLLKKLIPPYLLDRYHFAMAHVAAFAYGYPSKKMRVIGVTGTNGKSTVVNLLATMLEGAGHTVGFATTVNFGVAGKVWLNSTKMTMLGRFALQKMLKQMVDAGCTHAVIETSSEGIKQYRHLGIHYDAAIFTNLTPEHIESHGSFENYKAAKLELFKKLARDPHKELNGEAVKKIVVANVGSEHGKDFLDVEVDKKFGFFTEQSDASGVKWPIGIVKAVNIHGAAKQISFMVRDTEFTLHIPGVFNVENALAVISYGLSQGIDLEVMVKVLAKVGGIPGRMEFINEGQDFLVLVDYAPEPESLRKMYDVVDTIPKRRLIHVIGSCGGGRDKARRPILGNLAAEHADMVIVTNEDPYDDDPMEIINEVADGAIARGMKEGENLWKIPERRDAIVKAIELAGRDDMVVATGKGAEQAIVVAYGKKLPWDEREALRSAIKEKRQREV